MKKLLFSLILCFSATVSMLGQGVIEGTCGDEIGWTFDGKTLTLNNITEDGFFAAIPNYDTKNHQAPWNEEGFIVRNVRIGIGITAIGSCAFAGQDRLVEVVFDGNVLEAIEWGAFYNCTRLSNISIPSSVRKIGTIAFANCTKLTSIKIPDQCHVQDQAFLNCYGVRSLEISPTASLGQYVFANEVKVDGQIRHSLYNHELTRLPSHINEGNCNKFGLSKDAVNRLRAGHKANFVDYDYKTSEIDSVIPTNMTSRNNTYALIIGNQNYRFVPEVPYAIHDARVFRDYCEKTLGIPLENIHVVEDATKQLIVEDEFGWLNEITDRHEKKLIVYYAGHGVPDTKKNNKAYLLPTDVRGTKPQNGISLDDFYSSLGDLAFEQTAVFLDACFSGINRNNESVNEGTRGVEIEAEEGTLTSGNIVVFSAAQGNETAQGLKDQGHGLFTYYLIKELQESYGYISFGALANSIIENVSRHAQKLELRKSQTPSVNASGAIIDNWMDLSF